MEKCTLTLDVEYDPAVTDPESVAFALGVLLVNAVSTTEVLDEYGNPQVGSFEVQR